MSSGTPVPKVRPPLALKTRFKESETGKLVDTPEASLASQLRAVDALKKLQPDLLEALAHDNPRQMLKGTARWAILKQVLLAETAESEAVVANILSNLLDRAGLKPPEKTVNVNVDALNEDELNARIASALLDQYGEEKLSTIVEGELADGGPKDTDKENS